MLRRKIQEKIINYLENGSNKILVLNGARQIGKSYIIRHEGQKRFEIRRSLHITTKDWPTQRSGPESKDVPD